MSTNRTRHQVFATLAASALKGHLLLFGLHWALESQAQWVSAGIPFRIIEMGNIHKDTVANALYFCGESSLNNDFDMGDGAVPIYTNIQWDTIGVFGGRVQTIARWQDTLVIGGSFTGVNGIPYPQRCAMWNGDAWVPFGIFNSSIYRFKVIENELYAIGSFTHADGQLCNGIAKRQTGQWIPVGSFDVINPPNIQDLVKWNGMLYATGTIRFGSPNPKDVAYLSENGMWLPLGSGILGGFGAGRALAVYNNDLYVSGSIQLSAGNAGNGIMRWDGQAYHPVGTGFQGLDGTTNSYGGAIELEVHDNKLWACGTFSYAGNVPCPGIAYWDGTRWCGLPLGPEPEINSIEFFHDTLFASCRMNLNGEPVNCAVKFIGSTYSDTCSAAIGVGLPAVWAKMPSGLRAYRDQQGTLIILGLPLGTTCSAQVFDPEGRLVHQGQSTDQGLGLQLQLPPLAPAYHLIRLGGHGVVRFLGP